MVLLHSDMIDEEMRNEDDELDTIRLFSTEDIDNATKASNFNKGLGPDCFDGNVLKNSEELRRKIGFEITDALNSQRIPEYLRSGRLVPLQKTKGRGPVNLDDIRPIVVRSHISKVMEKAILQKIKTTCPHLVDTKIY